MYCKIYLVIWWNGLDHDDFEEDIVKAFLVEKDAEIFCKEANEHHKNVSRRLEKEFKGKGPSAYYKLKHKIRSPYYLNSYFNEKEEFDYYAISLE